MNSRTSWDLDVAPRDSVEPRKAPAKRWRNWWRAPGDGQLCTGSVVVAGEYVRGDALYPSKDVARTKALQAMQQSLPPGQQWLDYIDAFPDGEGPGGAA